MYILQYIHSIHAEEPETERDCKRNLKNPSCKDGNARFTMIPLKALSDQV